MFGAPVDSPVQVIISIEFDDSIRISSMTGKRHRQVGKLIARQFGGTRSPRGSASVRRASSQAAHIERIAETNDRCANASRVAYDDYAFNFRKRK